MIAFPEGAKGAAKVFADRYRLQRFGRGGVIRVAHRGRRRRSCRSSVVGAEEAHPILFKMHTAGARASGLPFLPVTPTFPWLGPPACCRCPRSGASASARRSRPIASAPDAAGDDVLISRMTEELRARIQSMVDADRRARAGVVRGS